MERLNALEALAALAQDTRLDVFRLLVQAGATGIPAGEIAQALDVRQNTLSANLAVLLHAGLVRKAREGRNIRYFAQMQTMRDLLTFLLEDCCGGQPDLCRPLLSDLGGSCGTPPAPQTEKA